MQFHLMDNGIDSLKFGMLHYEKFLKNSNNLTLAINDYFSDLKFATIAIHNAIELFTKQILYDVNELLIFSVDVTDDLISGLLHEKYVENNRDAHIDFWLVGKVDTTYKTIEYNRCIEILKSIFKQELTVENYKTLESLGKKRNCLTHLGYWDDFGWYKVMVTINDTISLIRNFYYTTIRKADRYFEPTLINKLISLKAYADKELDEQWLASKEYYLCALYGYFEDLLEQNTDEYDLDVDEKTLALKEVSFTRKGNNIKLNTKLLPRKEAMLFLKDDKICGIINVDKIEWEQGSDGSTTIIEKSFDMYYFKEEMPFDVDMDFNWDKIGKCNDIVHMFNQISKD